MEHSKKLQFYIQEKSLFLLIEGLNKTVFAFPITISILGAVFSLYTWWFFIALWVASSYLLSVVRWFTHQSIQHKEITPHSIKSCLFKLYTIDFSTGVILGFSAFFIPYIPVEHKWLLLVVVSAMSTQAASIHAPFKLSFLSFLIPLYVLFGFFLLQDINNTSIILPLLIIVNGFFVYGIFLTIHKQLYENFKLSFLNEEVTAELRQKNQAIEKSNEQLAMANQAKSNFLADISAEIKAPIINLSSLLSQAERQSNNNETKKLLHLAQSTSNTIVLLLKDLINVNLLENGEIIRQDAPFNVRELFETLMQVHAVNKQQLNLFCHVKENVPEQLISDAARINEITANLLNNAFKFTKNGAIGITVDFITEQEKHWLQVAVNDTGIGISQQKIDLIFQPFIKQDEPLSYEGKGLGLAICQQLCVLLGGNIKVESILGKKSQFTFTIPVALHFSQLPKYQGKKVIIVENDPLQQQAISSQLKFLSVPHLCVSQAKDAMQLCASDKNSFDSVIIGHQEKLAEKLLINLASRLHINVICLSQDHALTSSSNSAIPTLMYPVSTAELMNLLPFSQEDSELKQTDFKKA